MKQRSQYDTFPFDVLRHLDFPGRVGARIRALQPWSMIPPYPWGHWTYARLIGSRCRRRPGDYAELGVGVGGTSLLLGGLARAAGKRMWSLDSFRGLPAPSLAHDNSYFYAGEYGPRANRSLTLRESFDAVVSRHGLSSTIRVREGFFAETLPLLPARLRLSFLHIDADLHDSVLDGLTHLYDRVVPGGVIAIDDFFHHAQGPARAASTFFRERGLSVVYHVALPYSVVLIKGERPTTSARRSLDGNIYEFDLLRRDPELRRVMRASRAAARGKPTEARAALFLELLERRVSASSDIYEFELAFAAFWDLFENTRDRRTRITL